MEFEHDKKIPSGFKTGHSDYFVKTNSRCR